MAPDEATSFIDIGEVALAVRDAGEGRPFIWGHGLTSSMAAEDSSGLFDWQDLTGVRLVRYDARGHGRSMAPPDITHYRWPNLAVDMLEVADALGVWGFVAGGASMGCATALHAALLEPDRVEGLVLVIPPTAWETRAPQAVLYEQSARFMSERGTAAWVEAMRAVPISPVMAELAEEVREARFTHLATLDQRTFPYVLRGAALSDLPKPEELATLSQPSLVLAWAGDPGHPVSTADRLVETLPNATLHVADSLAELYGWPKLVQSFLDNLS